MADMKKFQDLLNSLSKDQEDPNDVFAKILQQGAGTSIFNRLNPQEIQLPEPSNIDALISGAYSQSTGSAIPFFDLQNYRNYIQGADIRSPQDITSFVTQDIAAKPGMTSRTFQSPDRKKMEAYYGLENIDPETGYYTGRYGRGLSKIIKGRPDYT